MTTPTLTPRNFTAHVSITARDASPAMQSGLHESVDEFFGAARIAAGADPLLQTFEPIPSNEWVVAGYAGAAVYRAASTTPDDPYPFTLATYVEGDVTHYRFPRIEDATRAGRLWRIGLI